MSEKLNRRKFVLSLSALSAALPLGASAFDFVPSPGKDFSFLLLGDIHFDKVSYHDIDYVRNEFSEGDVNQVKNYARISSENFPRLIQMAKAKAADVNGDFYLQLGDFVEGLCGSERLASQQVNGFISYMREQELNRPFFVIKGNHDITGAGAHEAFRNVVLPWQSREQRKSMEHANSTFVHKNARFVLFDGYTAEQSLEWLRSVLAEHKEDLLFFCIHQPVVPFNARANWHVFSKPKQQPLREELLNLLGEHKAIVLCGHLHKTSILTRSTAKGNIVQICTGSVIESLEAPVKDHLDGLQHYHADLVNLEPKFSPSSLDERKRNLEDEKPFIRHYEYADFMGYSTISVSSSNEVKMAVYQNAQAKPWKVLNVSKLFDA